MDNSKKQALNTFFSNFSEVNFGNFNSKGYKDSDLINFSILHNYINADNKIKVEGSYFTIKDSYVAESVKKYFGLTIKHQKTDRYSYSNGTYKWPAASGEPSPNFSQAVTMYKNKDGSYSVSLEIYNAATDYEGDKMIYKPKNLWGKDFKPELIGRATAIIKMVKINDKQTYQLIQYNLNQDVGGGVSGKFQYIDPKNSLNEILINTNGNNEVNIEISINTIRDKSAFIELSGTMKNNVFESSFNDDGWGEKGTIILTLKGNSATLKITVKPNQNSSGWGITSGTYTFTKVS
ncbi:hypothetical protein [Paenibacillus sp. NPDC057934]|uniref:hypothetical protein n=1 Tax=Paenibacillus sp. NPDC057934 TaxID=3346282 RepID=UPI0036D94CBD